MAKGKKGFEPGFSGNPNGRPLGMLNKIARPIKEQLADFLNEKILELPEIWLKLSARDKKDLLINLLPFYMAKLQAMSITGEVNFKSLPEDQLDQIAYKLDTLNKKSNG